MRVDAGERMQALTNLGLPIRAVAHGGAQIKRTEVVRDPRLMEIATRAITDLGDGPLRPTGAVRDALDGGRLIGSRSAATLDSVERLLATGTPDASSNRAIGTGMNDVRHAITLRGDDGASIDAVTKTLAEQGAQEHFGWAAARAFGIDHRVAPVGRAADGSARIAYVPGSSLVAGGVHNARTMEIALAQSHLAADAPLSPAEAAQAARVESQLMRAFDYVLANSDRHGGNGIVDARSGVTLIDQGHIGRGSAHAADRLVPGMRSDFLGATDNTVELDDVTVDFLRRRLDGDGLRAIHAATLRGDNRPYPVTGEFGHFNTYVESNGFIDGAVARLEHLVETGRFRHGDPNDRMRALAPEPPPAGRRGARFAAQHDADFGGGGFGRWG